MNHVDRLLQEFKKFPVVDEYGKKLNKEPPPKSIYHYTNGEGLRGIFESGKIWFTDIFYLNDISEIRHGVSYACELLNSRAQSAGLSELQRKFSLTVAKKLTENIEESANYFVCCFSKQHDELGQWRAYADNGRGFAIGFKTEQLEVDFVRAGPKARSTFPLSYDGLALHEMQEKVIAEAFRVLALAGREVTSQFLTGISVHLSALIIHGAIYFKHAGYKNEEEYRFMEVHPGGRSIENLKIRTKPYSLVRYCEFDWKSKSLSSLYEVIVGPAADPIQAKRYVDDCRRLYLPAGLNINVRTSLIPYRGGLP